jgi:hypothetical protein
VRFGVLTAASMKIIILIIEAVLTSERRSTPKRLHGAFSQKALVLRQTHAYAQ